MGVLGTSAAEAQKAGASGCQGPAEANQCSGAIGHGAQCVPTKGWCVDGSARASFNDLWASRSTLVSPPPARLPEELDSPGNGGGRHNSMGDSPDPPHVAPSILTRACEGGYAPILTKRHGPPVAVHDGHRAPAR